MLKHYTKNDQALQIVSVTATMGAIILIIGPRLTSYRIVPYLPVVREL